MNILKLKSPAKINLTLKIENKLPDGYHNLTSIMQTINMFDKIILTKSNKLTFSCSDKNLPADEKNLAVKAAIEFFKFIKCPPSVAINLYKKIPSQAGLGGASSNAAYVLIGLNKLLNTKLTKIQLCNLAQKIGSDVSFFIFGHTALARGKGEVLTKLKPLSKCHILIVKPKNFNVSTQQAFNKHDLTFKNNPAANNLKDKKIKQIILHINKGSNILNFGNLLFNDFEDSLNFKPVNEIKSTLQKLQATCCLMTGSGSSVFGIFKNLNELKLAYSAFPDKNYFKYICRPI